MLNGYEVTIAIAIMCSILAMGITAAIVGNRANAKRNACFSEAVDATATLKRLQNGHVDPSGATFSVTCDLEIDVPTTAYRESARYRIQDRYLCVPILWMPRFEVGLSLIARVVPSDRSLVRIFLPDGTLISRG